MIAALKPLQGTWNITTLEVDGRPVPLSGGQIVVEGEHFTSLGMGAVYEGTLAVDTAKQPWSIDMHFTAGPEKGNVNRGIFELEGDRWRLCLQMTGKDRPKTFATKPGAGLALETLERTKPSGRRKPGSAAKPSAIQPPPDFPIDPVPELDGEWTMEACAMNGSKLPPAMLKMGKRVAEANLTTITMGPQVILKAYYAIDRTQHPHHIDYVLIEGADEGKRQHGIFELHGDSLRVAFAPVGEPRPPDFNTNPGDGRTVATWKRARR